MPPQDQSELPTLAFVVELACQVGAVIKADGAKCKEIKEKMSVSDVVTATDVAVENTLRAALRAAFPSHRFFGEETSGATEPLTDEPTWVVDPVDGTTNFVHTFPLHTTSIAFCVNRQPQLAVVYCPQTDELFSAERGKGAWLNGKPLRASSCTQLDCALVTTGFHVGLLKRIRSARAAGETAYAGAEYDKFRSTVLANTQFIIENCRDLRRTGCASIDLAYTAAGRLDAYVEIGPHEWDFAAGILLLTEAGGHVMGFAGAPFDLSGREIVCAGTRALAEALSSSLAGSPLAPGAI